MLADRHQHARRAGCRGGAYARWPCAASEQAAAAYGEPRGYPQQQEYVDCNYTDCECTLSGIAKSLYVSPGYLSAVFKETVGESFINYLTGLRMKRAKQLLAGTELMIYEVAIMVGYENQTYFSTVFKKSAGISPKDYRESVRQPEV